MKRMKLTRKSLDELAIDLPEIDVAVQKIIVGGGDGSRSNPYTYEEYRFFLDCGYFPGGCVLPESSSAVGSSSLSTIEYVSSANNGSSAALCISGSSSTYCDLGTYSAMYETGYDTGYKLAINSISVVL